jgi:serine/threonine-protein kinase
MTRRAQSLLEPGHLLSGALFQDFLRSGGVDALAPGTRLGAFRVVRELGRGGMGVVHLAERDDGEFQQQVALKSMVDRDSAAGSELFRRERQILAGLHHPNIARLLDGGRADDGQLWFAMEWVDGERIDHHCARHALSFEARLKLWIEVADAVQFAHARLLIHRDIKPGNVFVDADGRPRLLDFGIAGLAGERVQAWSPGHASPEQRAGAAVGIASDQYQLGRLLSRLLAAGAQVPRASPHTASVAEPDARSVRDEPLVIAPTLAVPRGRQRELDAILARACALDPAQRYASVAGFKADIERLLAREPVEVLAGGWRYTMACAMRRHPRTSIVASVTVLAIVGLVAVFSLRLAGERDSARAEAAKAQAINAFVSDDLLRTADPYEGHAPDLTVRQALDRARDRIGARFTAQPDVEAALRATLGWSYAGLSEYDSAIDQLEHALALRATLEPRMAPESRRQRIELAHNLVSASRYADAEPLLRDFINEAAAVPGAQEDRFHAEITLAEMLGFTGRSDEALAIYDTTGQAAARLGPAQHALVSYRDDAQAHLLLLLGRPAEALAQFESIAARSSSGPAANPLYARRADEGRARALRDLGRFDEAIALFRSLHAACEAAFGREHNESLRNHNELAVALSRSGQRDEAIAIWREDLDARERRFGAGHRSTLTTRYNLANELAMAGHSREAEQAFRGVLGGERSALGASDPGALTTQISLAEVIGRQGRPREALAMLDEARGLGHTTLAGRPESAVLDLVRSRQLAALGQHADALVAAREADTALERSVGSAHRRAREAQQWLRELEASASTP